MDNRPIGVFDSGVGGLTAVRQLQALLPGEDIVYFGDTGRVPYGTRSPETIFQYAKQDITFLLSKNVKYIIAACGTVSSILPESYTDSLPVPYTGVLSAAVAAAVKASASGRIGVIGTPATIRSNSYRQRIEALRPSAPVTTNPCPLFVPLVENGYVQAGNVVTTTVAEEYLAPLRKAEVDTLILGCTHYPLIAGIIDDVMGGSAALSDPGRETALVAREKLSCAGLLAEEGRTGRTEYYVSDLPESFETTMERFLQPEFITSPRVVAIENY